MQIICRLSRKIFSKYLIAASVRNMSKCTVAVCQFTATNNKAANLKTVKTLVGQAKEKHAKIAFLPEASDFIASNKKEARELAESINGDLMNDYKLIAKNNSMWLSIGGFHEKVDEDTIYNSHILLDSSGEIKSIYRKIHLFDVAIPEKNIYLRESDLNVGGSQIFPPSGTPAGLMGLAICYDLRFPELAILQTKMGAQILTYPSAFTHSTGEAHWEVLLRARAIENQCYVVAAAQFGKHNPKRTSYGQAMIIDPWGKILAECPKYTGEADTNERIAIADIDLDYLKKVRQEMPVQQHRRNDIYDLSIINCESASIDDDETFKFADKVVPGSTVFLRSKYCYAFTNIRCVVPGRILFELKKA
ncbi:unnamed protein product [Acanthoscelides obtectus]|uniref:CN hydrolase domain-containing protein n=1 Tax=Acanthoscelides obtectus TaxID=200917 RepID=A0A9P0LPQ8_ACAOB|nr:unnamed protein product [Acanthoscelides obtectus]CAK1644089.1 Nitrilase and fragile histidine triad fusion protein NitFhit [Acanthoscelides obtectus]